MHAKNDFGRDSTDLAQIAQQYNFFYGRQSDPVKKLCIKRMLCVQRLRLYELMFVKSAWKGSKINGYNNKGILVLYRRTGNEYDFQTKNLIATCQQTSLFFPNVSQN